MTSHDDLASLFGTVTRPPLAQLEEIGLSPESARFLAEVGLPDNAPPLFTTRVQSLFSPYEFTLGGEPAKILVIGGPPGDPESSFFLDVHDDLVGLFSFSATAPGSEVVNTSLANFVTFIRLYAEHAPPDADPAERRKAAQALSARLRELDEFAFDRPDGWWSVVLDHLQGDLRI